MGSILDHLLDAEKVNLLNLMGSSMCISRSRNLEFLDHTCLQLRVRTKKRISLLGLGGALLFLACPFVCPSVRLSVVTLTPSF